MIINPQMAAAREIGRLLKYPSALKVDTFAKSSTFYSREGFVSVSLSWVLISLVGALPFAITGEIPFYIDSLFETVSGFTTTGASILSSVEELSHSSAFWRL